MQQCNSCKSENLHLLSEGIFDGYVCDNCNYGSIIYKQDYCCENRKLIEVRFEQSNGVLVQRTVCENCRTLLRGAKKKDANFNNYRIYHQTSYIADKQAQDNSRHELSRQIRELSQQLNQKENAAWWNRYNAYLKTDVWKQKRADVLKRENNICQGCGKAEAKHVHHTTYENLGDELLFQLIALCVNCHSKLHPDKDFQ